MKITKTRLKQIIKEELAAEDERAVRDAKVAFRDMIGDKLSDGNDEWWAFDSSTPEWSEVDAYAPIEELYSQLQAFSNGAEGVSIENDLGISLEDAIKFVDNYGYGRAR